MKNKLKIMLVFIVLTLVGCQNDGRVVITKIEYENLKQGEKERSLTVGTDVFKVFTGSDGHDYIKQDTYGMNYYIYTHIGGCEKCLTVKDSLKL